MEVELRFDIGDRYSIALLVFFITYFIFEIPSNVVLRKFGAANWLSFLCFAWGIVTMGAGWSKRWTVSLDARFLELIYIPSQSSFPKTHIKDTRYLSFTDASMYRISWSAGCYSASSRRAFSPDACTSSLAGTRGTRYKSVWLSSTALTFLPMDLGVFSHTASCSCMVIMV